MSHEEYSRELKIEGSSNRAFGIVFAVVFTIVGVWPLFAHNSVLLWSILAAVAVLGITFDAPHWLTVPNRPWTQFGLLPGRVISPIVAALLFPFCSLLTVWQCAISGRMRCASNTTRICAPLDRPGPDPKSMKDQF